MQERFLHEARGQEVLGAGRYVGVGHRRGLPLDQAEFAAFTASQTLHPRVRRLADTGGWRCRRGAVLAGIDRKSVFRASGGGDHRAIGEEECGCRAHPGGCSSLDEVPARDRSVLELPVKVSDWSCGHNQTLHSAIVCE
jgi:hypothetical protein